MHIGSYEFQLPKPIAFGHLVRGTSTLLASHYAWLLRNNAYLSNYKTQVDGPLRYCMSASRCSFSPRQLEAERKQAVD